MSPRTIKLTPKAIEATEGLRLEGTIAAFYAGIIRRNVEKSRAPYPRTGNALGCAKWITDFLQQVHQPDIKAIRFTVEARLDDERVPEEDRPQIREACYTYGEYELAMRQGSNSFRDIVMKTLMDTINSDIQVKVYPPLPASPPPEDVECDGDGFVICSHCHLGNGQCDGDCEEEEDYQTAACADCGDRHVCDKMEVKDSTFYCRRCYVA